MSTDLLSSVTRIADFDCEPYDVTPVDRSRWSRGDYVVGRINRRPSPQARVEAPSGRTIEPLEGERLIGALGTRKATREIVGSWEEIDTDGQIQVIGGGGVLGRVTSMSPFLPDPISLSYLGHVTREGSIQNMQDFVEPTSNHPLQKPTLLVTGTSMSAGKTTAARVLIRLLKEEGHGVAAAKLAGSARFHDVLSMRDAGAGTVHDFVDVGLPTTILDPEEYRPRLRALLSRLQNAPEPVVVVETGASPLEPYNGDLAIQEIGNLVFTVVCASDPYSVLGLIETFPQDLPVDLVAGIATNTGAGIELIEQLTALPALNLHLETSKDDLRTLIRTAMV